ncbi:MAG: biotin-dependent carboxyltransferase family protein [Leucothrix sp.]
MSTIETGFTVLQPGILALLQDAGRFGQHAIGLTNGGPLDRLSFDWANRLCGNDQNACAIEASIGGLILQAEIDTQIAITGGDAPLTINGQSVAPWQTHAITKGDKLGFGFSQTASRHYLAVNGGFQLEPMFGSCSTVTREKLGGLNGAALQINDKLPCITPPVDTIKPLRVNNASRPDYSGEVVLRVILGYQHAAFSHVQKARFFNNTFELSDKCDRMGFRLAGPDIQSGISGMLSEGICYGAIQIPADGQPIVLLNDRQTIGGYPKMGSVLSLDIPKLTQRMPGTAVRFEAITIDEAQRQLHLANYRYQQAALTPINP